MKSSLKFALSLLMLLQSIFICSIPSISHTPIDHNKSTIAVTIPLKQHDWLYKEYLSFSIDHPDITLSEWKSNNSAESKYDPHFQETKKVFTQPTTITLNMTVHTDKLINTNLHMTYCLKSEKKLIKQSFPLVLNTQPLITVDEPTLSHAIELPSEQQITPVTSPETITISTQSWSNYFACLDIQPESWWMKVIFAFLLFTLSLLIVGARASSLNLLPQAGSWIIEIKRFFGFVLIGMSLYFMRTIISTYIVLLAFALLQIIVGITYFFIAHKESSTIMKAIKNNIGFLMLASSVFILFKSAQWYYQNPVEHINWHTDYTAARTLACTQHKPLLIDIGSPHCSLCCSIDNHIFCNKHVADCCNRHYIALKVDDSTCDKFFKQKYTVFGAPTILLVDPETETIVKQWGGEVYHQQPQQFITQLRS